AGLDDSRDEHQSDEYDAEYDHRPVRQVACPGRSGRRPGLGCAGLAHWSLRRRSSSSPATIITATMTAPRTTWAVFGSTPIAVRIGLSVKKMIPAAAAPTTDPAPPPRTMPPSTTAARLLSVPPTALMNRGSPEFAIAVSAMPASPANPPPVAYATTF